VVDVRVQLRPIYLKDSFLLLVEQPSSGVQFSVLLTYADALQAYSALQKTLWTRITGLREVPVVDEVTAEPAVRFDEDMPADDHGTLLRYSMGGEGRC
jgi:hypothetical protein